MLYEVITGRYEEFKTFFHGHSYTANPLGCAAAIATLSIFGRENVLMRVSRLGRTMERALMELSGHRNVGEVRRKGLMAGIEIVADRATRERFPPEKKVGHRITSYNVCYTKLLRRCAPERIRRVGMAVEKRLELLSYNFV